VRVSVQGTTLIGKARKGVHTPSHAFVMSKAEFSDGSSISRRPNCHICQHGPLCPARCPTAGSQKLYMYFETSLSYFVTCMDRECAAGTLADLWSTSTRKPTRMANRCTMPWVQLARACHRYMQHVCSTSSETLLTSFLWSLPSMIHSDQAVCFAFYFQSYP
jgi:hypothetical protein